MYRVREICLLDHEGLQELAVLLLRPGPLVPKLLQLLVVREHGLRVSMLRQHAMLRSMLYTLCMRSTICAKYDMHAKYDMCDVSMLCYAIMYYTVT